MDLDHITLFPKEIYALEQFISYEYYVETVRLWKELIQYAEDLLERYSANLAPAHRSQHPSHQADYVWGTIVLPNFKATLHHLMDGLEDLKEGFLPILRRMSSIGNDLIAQNRDYPPDWMDEVEKGATSIYLQKKLIISTRSTNIDIVSSYYHMQRDYKALLKDEYLIGIDFPELLPSYKLNRQVYVETGSIIAITGIYRSIEPYSACKFLIREKKNNEDWRTAPKVKAFKENPDNYTDENYEYSKRIPTTWILVERVTDKNDTDIILNNSKISQKAGEISSKTGYWTAPAQPNSRRYFKKGELLPTLSNQDWGEAYWYYDGDD